MPSFIKIVQAVKKLNSISGARLNFRRRPIFVQLCIETLCKRATSVAHLTNFSFECLNDIFPRQKLKKSEASFVAMNRLNKCAKFHENILSSKKVKFNLPSAIELSKTADLCTILYRNLRQASNFGGTFDQLFFEFLWNFHRRCLSTSSIPWCKKSKMTKTSNQGSCLKFPAKFLPLQ